MITCIYIFHRYRKAKSETGFVQKKVATAARRILKRERADGLMNANGNACEASLGGAQET